MKPIKKLATLTACTAFLIGGAAMAYANPSEKENLKKCELSICELVVKKQADGDNIACDLTKTWGAEELKKGASQGNITWNFGDARCHTKIDMKRGH